VLVSLLRPQEFIATLCPLSILNVCAAVAVAGLVFELVSGKQRVPWTPQLPWLGAFVVWGFLVTSRPLGLEGIPIAWDFVGLSTIFMLVVAFSARTLPRLRAIAAVLVACAGEQRVRPPLRKETVCHGSRGAAAILR
jgi:hypothetical protein